MIQIERTWPATEECNCGFVELSNGIHIYFSSIHNIKTQEEAERVANQIVNALNATNND